MKTVAAVCREPYAPLSIEEVDLREELNAEEVQVRIVATGICHTDLIFRDAPEDAPFMPRPSILGHEGAGIVQAVGSAVKDITPGDKVVLSYASDGECPACQKNLNSYCERYVELNLSGFDGHGGNLHSTAAGPLSAMHHQSSFARDTIAVQSNVYKVKDDIPLEQLAPLGCGFLTGAGAVANQLQPEMGSSIAVFGLGAVGFSAVAMARRLGCATIAVVDLHQHRLDLAATFGATHFINASAADHLAQMQATFPEGFDYVLEATGVPKVMTAAIELLGPNGNCLICGATSDPLASVDFSPLHLAFNRHISGALMGHGSPRRTIDTLMAMIKDGSFPADKLIRTYPLAEINEAIEDSGSGAVIKPVILMPE
jgi:aryl-alcohol dehydrogenase